MTAQKIFHSFIFIFIDSKVQKSFRPFRRRWSTVPDPKLPVLSDRVEPENHNPKNLDQNC